MSTFKRFMSISNRTRSNSTDNEDSPRNSIASGSQQQISILDGRDLSDTNHKDYDPALDPELRLRVTRTAAESIHESILEEDRRRFKRKAGTAKKPSPISISISNFYHPSSPSNSPGGAGGGSSATSPNTSPLKSRKSLFSRATTLRRKNSTNGNISPPQSPTFHDPPDPNNPHAEEEMGYEPRAKLERQRTQANAAAEAEESARRQERQDGSTSTVGLPGGEKRARDRKEWFETIWKSGEKEVGGLGGKGKEKERRVVFVNLEGAVTDPKGYERNKVRTSKYTLWTFIPKNLGEQFRRVANIYFLLLVVLQVFPIFGASAPQIAMLPLVAILGLTAIKDGIEDSRRHSLDNGVNNSAVTRLGDWKNVNQPRLVKNWWDFFSGGNGGGGGGGERISKGVKKLREKEGSFDPGFLYGEAKPRESRDTINPDSNTSIGELNLGDLSFDGDFNESNYTIDPPSFEYPPSRSRSFTIDSVLAPSTSGRSSNSRKSDVVSYGIATPGTARWERTLWKKLEVGDIVLLKEDDQIPADIIVLSTSDPEGICFVETKNLDGETNLKPRKALKSTMGISNEEDVEHARFWIDSEAPHANLYSYNAVLKYRTKGETEGREHPIIEGKKLEMSDEVEEAVTINELLLRGCALRNTKWVIGLVIYTGSDTKIMLNQGETPSKRSKIERETNFNVLVNFIILMVLCTICGVIDGLYSNRSNTSAVLYEADSAASTSALLDGLVTFGSSLIIFQNIVPISLVITVELVKTIQAFFIYQDLDMYYEPLDHPCLPKTWNISDDLGQIEYVFSDKTGTLTQNVMEFQKCAVDGIAYGEGITEAMLGAAKREGRDTSAFDPALNIGHLKAQKSLMIQNMKNHFRNRFLQEDKLTLISPSLVEDLTTRSEHQTRLVEFWRALAICHTVLADRSNLDDPNHIEYKAESPDEAALVAAARDVGFVFLNRTNAEIEIEVMGVKERYIPLRVLEFNSSRKRMSTLVRTPDNKILLICKGADSVIYQRLRSDHDQELIESTTKNLDDFSNAGLRTLCISSKYVTEEEFSKWSKIYDKACSSIEDREDEIEKACELIEGDLTILGATALEDKLQVGVPEAIAQLHQAGIKLWILTGDKLQTAIEIGFSCNLLSNSMEIMIISSDSETGTQAQIEAGLTKIARSLAGEIDEKEIKSGGFAVVIDGETLRFALDLNLKAMFLDLTTQCETVVCCRVSPSQKALTVRLVKEGKNAMTLAIGDGANDVAMIQEAHIGVGIAGLEGAQASMSADFAVGQFRYLNKLLLVHGRWCYIRIADMHATFFYKNIVWTLTLFYYQIYCNFDATNLYDFSLVMLFNLVFTSLPVAVIGIFDKDVSSATSLLVPQLYRRGIQGLEYTRLKFFAFMFDGFYQSIVAFFIPYLVYHASTTLSTGGYDFSVWEFGTTVAVCAVTTANVYVGLHLRYWTWIAFAVFIGSTLSIHVWIVIYSQFPLFTFENEVMYSYTTLNFWTSIILVQVAAIGPKFLWKYVRSAYFPLDSDIVREMEILGTCDKKADIDSEAQRQQEDLRLVESPTMAFNSPLATPPQDLNPYDSPLALGDLSSSHHGKEFNSHSLDGFGPSPILHSNDESAFNAGRFGNGFPPEIVITGSTPRTSVASSSYSRNYGEEEE